ncbi:MAG TPA: CapA family protein [Longimicrobiaceae bacterium]|nr:CapA family protein [Longimicrobiaceae bacterium]
MDRREFLARGGGLVLGASLAGCAGPRLAEGEPHAGGSGGPAAAPGGVGALTLFLAGDVMTGRGIDQVLPHSVDPRLHEPHVLDARTYVALAERANGPIPDRAHYGYPWGEALGELRRVRPHARIVNLETAVTTSDDWWRGKAIHYRMHPGNVPVLTAAGLDVCVLGNNHVMDWGGAGLRETLRTLRRAGLRTPGAGEDREEAEAPAAVGTSAGRLLVFSYGSPTAGVPPGWRAGEGEPGVNFLPELGAGGAREVIEHVRAHRREGDRVVVSIHWGGNWGYEVPPPQRDFAHRLVDAGAADVVHGHSSHHPKGIEVYRGRLILYGAGDFLNDYEGIEGHETFRGDLTLMYFPTLDRSGALVSLEMAPMRIRRFRLQRASREEARWLQTMLDRESRRFGARVEATPTGRLALHRE